MKNMYVIKLLEMKFNSTTYTICIKMSFLSYSTEKQQFFLFPNGFHIFNTKSNYVYGDNISFTLQKSDCFFPISCLNPFISHHKL